MTKVMKVLYAEDNPQDADLTLAHFKQVALDFDLEVVDTGSACLERLAAGDVELLLLDNHLPDFDGVDLLVKLRAQGHRLPVVMVTGIGDDETVARALRAGAADYVPKSAGYLEQLPAILRGVIIRQQQGHHVTEESARPFCNILYIEPNPMDVELTLTQLASSAPHLHLHCVENAQQALELLQNASDFELVLTDLRVPGMNATELIREVQQRGIDLPFIVITGRGDEATAVTILQLGAFDYMVKRDNYLMKLPHAIDHAIDRYKLNRAATELRQELITVNASLEHEIEVRTAHLLRELDKRQRLESDSKLIIEKLKKSQAESQRLLVLANKSRRAILGVLEDQSAVTEDLKRSKSQLEYRVQERTAELEIARDRAETADLVKSTFLATMSHELRTPLNSIIGFGGVLLQGLPGPLNEEQTKQITIMTRAGEHLLALVNDVLDISKIEAGELHIRREQVNLPEVLKQVLAGFQTIADSCDVKLKLEIEPGTGEILTDRRRLEQVIWNLVSNSLKFSDKGEVEVSCRHAAGQTVIAVKDTGIGIHAKDIGKLFKPFVQLEVGPRRVAKGTGLGLAISYRIVKALGGELIVQSTPGSGSCFSFSLPDTGP